MYEMKRLGRNATGHTTLAAHLTTHGLVLEMPSGPLPGMYDRSDPSGPGRLLFAFFAAMAETERENIREATLEGLDTAAGHPSSPTTCCTPRSGAMRTANRSNACRVVEKPHRPVL
ncbi:recombinase family protein [Streptomyces niveus]|uniref:recombinase family protein n=1 Tax=Streptomyces niveus TaxID=193462 RepID=UPI00343E3FFF